MKKIYGFSGLTLSYAVTPRSVKLVKLPSLKGLKMAKLWEHELPDTAADEVTVKSIIFDGFKAYLSDCRYVAVCDQKIVRVFRVDDVFWPFMGEWKAAQAAGFGLPTPVSGKGIIVTDARADVVNGDEGAWGYELHPQTYAFEAALTPENLHGVLISRQLDWLIDDADVAELASADCVVVTADEIFAVYNDYGAVTVYAATSGRYETLWSRAGDGLPYPYCLAD